MVNASGEDNGVGVGVRVKSHEPKGAGMFFLLLIRRYRNNGLEVVMRMKENITPTAGPKTHGVESSK